MFMRSFLVISCIALLLGGCSGGDREGAGESAPAVDKKAVESQKIRSKQSIQPISADRLLEALPPEIPGARALEPSVGTQVNNGRTMTTVTAEYIGTPQGKVLISVTDFADIADMIDGLANFIDGAQAGEIVERPEGRGLESWDRETRSGRLRFLAFSRFSISVEMIDMPEEAKELYARPSDMLNYFSMNVFRVAL